jgi:hypothetical protein
MKIRSITYFCNPTYPLDEKVLQKAGDFLARARTAYETAGYEVQTVRLATIPFPELLGEENLSKLPELTSDIDTIAQALKIGYVSLGPALPELPRSYEVLPDAIFVSKNVFFSGKMADTTRGVNIAAVRACAEVIAKCASIEPNGFANLQFAALANVNAGAPFFPAAYHDSDQAVFAIATDNQIQKYEDGDGAKKRIPEGERERRRAGEHIPQPSDCAERAAYGRPAQAGVPGAYADAERVE